MVARPGILNTPSGTDEDPSGNSYGWGYNGQTNGWVDETVDLSEFAGQNVQIRFEYITDAALNGEGFILDDVRVDAPRKPMASWTRSGGDRERVRSRIDELALSKRGILAGWMQRRHALRLIRDSFCLVLNSRTEAYPLVILEAMALGRPVISPQVGGIGHMLTDGENALLFPASDQWALAHCLLRMDRNPELAERLGARASADYRRLATPGAVLDRYLELYRD